MKTMVTALVALMIATATYACSCSPITNVIYHVATSDEIFIGRCVSGTLTGQTIAFEFDDVRSLMGSQRSTATVLSHKEGSMCGYKFTIGDEYLIYCFLIDDQLWTDICRPTKRIEATNEQRAELAEIADVQTNAATQDMLRKLRDLNKNPQQGAGVVREPRSGSRAPQP